jgi:crossover junction endodeoxyribonuclease RusA
VILHAFVRGEAKPQGSKRGFVTKTGRVAMVEMAGKPLKTWREQIAWTARGEAAKQGWEQTDAPVSVKLEFYLKRPKKPKFSDPAVRPDVDKLTRAVLDALTASQNIWQDDSQVVRLIAEKHYARPGEEGLNITLWKTQ